MTDPSSSTPPLAVPPLRPGEPPPATPSKLTGGKLAVIVLVIVGACALPLIGVVSAVSIYGVRKYIGHARAAEAAHEVSRLAGGIARCASETGENELKRGLPESSAAVPPTLSALGTGKYQSKASEWTGAFACAGFTQFRAQYYQYRWLKRSPTNGVAMALSDFDGDGVPDVSIEQDVTCPPGGACTLGPLVQAGP
jgi:hypothetical protein